MSEQKGSCKVKKIIELLKIAIQEENKSKLTNWNRYQWSIRVIVQTHSWPARRSFGTRHALIKENVIKLKRRVSRELIAERRARLPVRSSPIKDNLNPNYARYLLSKRVSPTEQLQTNLPCNTCARCLSVAYFKQARQALFYFFRLPLAISTTENFDPTELIARIHFLNHFD